MSDPTPIPTPKKDTRRPLDRAVDSARESAENAVGNAWRELQEKMQWRADGKGYSRNDTQMAAAEALLRTLIQAEVISRIDSMNVRKRR